MTASLPASVVREADLNDKYDLQTGWAFMSGTQALVRLAFEQRLRDEAAGLNTAGFISGYRGSPLGRYDLELWRNTERLKKHHIHFQPGVNEDLAATALWGSQYVGTFQGAKYDGVFGLWYGKTPGVDRSADALRHANGAGTAPHGGVLALCGDDHGAKSSTQAAQSDYILSAVGIPVLYPANVQEILDYGLHGIAMSRYAGCWVGLKLVTDVVESSASVRLNSPDFQIHLPEGAAAAESLSIRAADPPLQQEARLYQLKLPAALAYARANRLNRIVLQSQQPKVGILTAGKAYGDVLHALTALGLAQPESGVRVLKLGMVWPLDSECIAEFVEGLDTIVVVEEKRSLLESQLKTILFDMALGRRIRVIGKFDGRYEWSKDRGQAALSTVGELSPAEISAVLAPLMGLSLPLAAEAKASDSGLTVSQVQRLPASAPGPVRPPSFCSGCPHNTSTKVPEGSRALAGIGCHGIAMSQQPGITGTISHMGGEGVMWVGQAPFTHEKHIFANLGDGTYFHSGILAIRQAIAAKVSMTYKLLVNGFVSMTGGQPVDGELTIPQMATELVAEGVGRVVVVTDDPSKYEDVALPAGVQVHHRRELDAVQRELREFPLVSVLIYDQMCATERRRLRKRGKYPDPTQRTFIHEAVCEGCGDCSSKSNCMSVEPLDTELGRKRRINQSSCNKDFSCVEGFCPSFVTVKGGQLRRPEKAAAVTWGELPEPVLPVLNDQSYGMLITGIGGTGVITVGAVLAMAAHLDNKAVSTLDVTGLAQKYGAVMSHVSLARDASLLHASRLASGGADVLIGCDLVVSAGDEALARLAAGRSRAVVNAEVVPTSEFLRNPDWQLDSDTLLTRLRQRLTSTGSAAPLDSVAATRIAGELLGDVIAANMLLLGYAWQKGWVPVSRAAIEKAIELNGVSIELNLQGFLWGRRLAHDTEAVLKQMQPAPAVVQWVPTKARRLEDIVEDRANRLVQFQNQKYADRYQQWVTRVYEVESKLGSDAISKLVARHYFKLLAFKDEFEVARLYTAPEFRQRLDTMFEGDYALSFHLGAWPFAQRDPKTGQIRKRELSGKWLMPAFRVLAGLRGLRGSVLDPFRHSEERKLALDLIARYEQDLQRLIAELDAGRLELAQEIANWPEFVRGYGHVREASVRDLEAKRQAWWGRWVDHAARS